MRTISVRLDDGSEARLNNLCQTLGLSQSEVVKAGLALLQLQSISPSGNDRVSHSREPCPVSRCHLAGHQSTGGLVGTQ
ncbi:MAG: CopG family transcriptional regulator [Cyanobacteria bacterium K_Offshore_surface_m2_239]|nr:CopG family transcriptional regulator [Cyanobacteria bacterium K_Offshore_surface_m2_239]